MPYMCMYENNKPYSEGMLECFGIMCLMDAPHCATLCRSLCIHKCISAGAVTSQIFLGSVKITFIEVSRLLIDFSDMRLRLRALLFCDLPCCHSRRVDMHASYLTLHLETTVLEDACVLSPA